MSRHTVAVMLQIETDDDRLDPDHISVATAEQTRELRRAVLANIKNVTRVIAVMPLEYARLLMLLHDAVGNDVTRALGLPPSAVHPPADYEPPGGR